MELAGFSTSQPASREVLNDPYAEAISLNKVPAYCVFNPTQVELNREFNTTKPSLRIAGYVSRVVPRQQMPYDVRVVHFSEENRPFMTVDYEFDNTQLKHLVDKGLFEKGFAPPRNKLKEVELEFVTGVDITVVPPRDIAGPPLVVVNTRDMDLVVLNDEHKKAYPDSIYDLAAEFDNFMPELQDGYDYDTKGVSIENSLDLGNLDSYGVSRPYVDRQELVEDGELSVVARLQELAGGQLSLTAYDVLSVITPNEDELVQLAQLQKAQNTNPDDVRFEKLRDEMAFGDNETELNVKTEPEVEASTDLVVDDIEIDGDFDSVDIELDDDQTLVETQAQAQAQTQPEAQAQAEEQAETDEPDFDDFGSVSIDTETAMVFDVDNEDVLKASNFKARKKSEAQRRLEEIQREQLNQQQSDTKDSDFSL